MRINDSSWIVRINAVRKITDPDLLAVIALKDEMPWIREAAIEQLNDPKRLKRILDESIHSEDRIAALGKIDFVAWL